jgi:hypothetical protein
VNVVTETGLGMITRGLRIINQLTPGRSPNASETAVGLQILRGMIDNFQTDALKTYGSQMDVYTLTINKASYTIGKDPAALVTADFDGNRPVKIDYANLVVDPNMPLKVALDLPTKDEWPSIIRLNISGRPKALYNDGGAPLSALTLDRLPDKAYGLELYQRQQLTPLTTASDLIVAPPGYIEAIAYNLAVRYAIEWGKPLRPEVADLARSTMADVMAVNSTTPLLRADQAFPATYTRGGRYNVLTDRYE